MAGGGAREVAAIIDRQRRALAMMGRGWGMAGMSVRVESRESDGCQSPLISAVERGHLELNNRWVNPDTRRLE